MSNRMRFVLGAAMVAVSLIMFQHMMSGAISAPYYLSGALLFIVGMFMLGSTVIDKRL